MVASLIVPKHAATPARIILHGLGSLLGPAQAEGDTGGCSSQDIQYTARIVLRAQAGLQEDVEDGIVPQVAVREQEYPLYSLETKNRRKFCSFFRVAIHYAGGSMGRDNLCSDY